MKKLLAQTSAAGRRVPESGYLNRGGKAAVALAFDGSSAPWVSHVGQNQYAEKMLAVARRYGIHVRYDSELVRQLYKLEEFDAVPEELYEPVARVFCEIDDLE